MSRPGTSSRVAERVVVVGKLVLQTPTHLGNGDVSFFTDSPVFRDMDGVPILSGATLAGALRAWVGRTNPQLADELFGYVTGTAGGQQATSLETAVLVNDARPAQATVEFRDGVAISPKTRTAEKGKKFDVELLTADMTFDVHLELTLRPDEKDPERLRQGFVTALKALEDGMIALGKRKTRGFGECRVVEWHAQTFNLAQPKQLIEWLKWNGSPDALTLRGPHIESLIGIQAMDNPAQPFRLKAEFEMDGSLLIRAQDPNGHVDMTHLHSPRQGQQKPVLSGTSLAGALRARALRIANTLCADGDRAHRFVDQMFGPRGSEGVNLKQNELRASRVRVKETVVEGGIDDLVQQRVKIDRFTGGAFPGALFGQSPLFGKSDTRVRIELSLAQMWPEQGQSSNAVNPAEIGLLLLVLKDLWTGDLPLGGESSVGRGRLKGIEAVMRGPGIDWSIHCQGDSLQVQGKEAMEACVQAFHQEMTRP